MKVSSKTKLLLIPAVLGPALAIPAASAAAATNDSPNNKNACSPRATAISFSDGLDKAVVGGVTVGGLSDMAWDKRRHAWASTVDNHGSDPARVWFWRDPSNPKIVGGPLVLKRPDGTPYDGLTADNEGLAVLPDGDYLVSSEAEPSLRVFGRDGVQKSTLPVPARFAVTPAGQAGPNATLEGLTITPRGDRIIAAMEGALSGDTDATLHRFLVYDKDRSGRWSLTKQTLYRAEPGLRVAEVAAYGRDSLLVLEAAFDPAKGNSVSLYGVGSFSRTPDVSKVADAAGRPAVGKTLVADLVKCPTLGAVAKEPQANPLMDNYEGMAVVPGRHGHTVHVISDDNFGAAQITRVLTLSARLP
nr:esterase-like activity of phytase family protein [uncultured Actinoplanes sp.]